MSIILKTKFLTRLKHGDILQGSTLKNFVSGYAVRSDHRIDILNAKSTGKKYLNVFITEQFIEKSISFWNSGEKFRRSHSRCSVKKAVLKNFAIFTGKHFHPVVFL